MKKIIKSILLFLSLGFLASCTNGTSDTGSSKMFMNATVTSVADRIEVNVYEAEYAEGIYWLVTDNSTEVKDADGGKISQSDIKEGDNIRIGYSGQVMLSYPPQVYAISIEKLG